MSDINRASSPDDTVSWIEQWYLSQCNGECEHRFGVRIDTLDNPGWSVSIDLQGTTLQRAAMEKLHRERTEEDWLSCEVKDGVFIGHGDPEKLREILLVFRQWVERVG